MQNKIQRVLGVTAAAIVVAAFSFGGVRAETKKAEPKAALCKTITDEFGCKAREDCTWVSGSVNKKTKKETKAYCRSKPRAKAPKAAPKA